jgi:oxygen-independent coproporphyrinogen-3 oxidase
MSATNPPAPQPALNQPPLALYVHFPWCVRKCPYCDFNSYTLHGELPESQYVAALAHDMQAQAPDLSGRPLVSIFMGGGTPSLFSPAAIARVLEFARDCFGFASELEVTLEANPGTIERGRFAEYRAAGITRVSLGAQSFDAGRLRALGRIHSPAETERAAQELHAAGLTNFNLDLMYGLPDQDVAGALSDLRQALALQPAHISHYQLTIEPGTVFAAAPPQLPVDESAAEMLTACEERLAAEGYAHYEVSAYARRGRECRHNANYWRFGDYVGVGAGAHGKLTFVDQGRIVRTAHTREPRRYLSMRSAPVCHDIARADLPFEFMLNALRLTAGFEPRLFESRTGLSWEVVATIMKALAARGLLEAAHGFWRPTALGARFLNEVLLSFLPTPGGRGSTPPATLDRSAAGGPLYTGVG